MKQPYTKTLDLKKYKKQIKRTHKYKQRAQSSKVNRIEEV